MKTLTLLFLVFAGVVFAMVCCASSKQGYINHHLDVDDSVPRQVLGGDFTSQNLREANNTANKILGVPEPQIHYLQNPMEKACYQRCRDDWPLWPVHYEYPYRDPLFKIMTTGLYTAANDDPEALSEQRLWSKVY